MTASKPRGQPHYVVVVKYEIVARDRATALLTVREWLSTATQPPESIHIEAERWSEDDHDD